jgi:FMN phosphatase YigB (HAD superfamily)
LRIPRYLSIERGQMTEPSGSAERLAPAEPSAPPGFDRLTAITFDFGNTLAPFPGWLLGGVVERMAGRLAGGAGCDPADFVRVWNEERSRQIAEDLPEGREADMDARVIRVLARLRGCPGPIPPVRWDHALAARYSDPAEVAAILDGYATAFVEITPVPPGVEPMLELLARCYRLAVLSNWPLASAVDRFVEAAGWRRYFEAVVISQRARCIKPCPDIFRQAAREMGIESGPGVMHVGDDLGADVAGAHGVGWRAAWVRIKPEDSTLPVAPASGRERPELTLDLVTDLPRALGIDSDAAS